MPQGEDGGDAEEEGGQFYIEDLAFRGPAVDAGAQLVPPGLVGVRVEHGVAGIPQALQHLPWHHAQAVVAGSRLAVSSSLSTASFRSCRVVI